LEQRRPLHRVRPRAQFERWADGTVEGNSMATRVGALVDEETGHAGRRRGRGGGRSHAESEPATPDISLMAALSDFPAAVVYPSYMTVAILPTTPSARAPTCPRSSEVGVRQVLVRNPDHDYWREGGWLDRIEFIDLGTDQSALLSSAPMRAISTLPTGRTRFRRCLRRHRLGTDRGRDRQHDRLAFQPAQRAL
jgi:hypothetical protein